MKKVSFVGTSNKIELLLNLSKIIQLTGKSVLIIDSTFEQRARYLVPSIKPMLKYITTYEEIDVAIGFNSMEEIYSELGASETKFPYDIVIVDIDVLKNMEAFKVYQSSKIYFATGFDNYTLKRGLETFNGNPGNITVEKIIMSKEFTRADDQYLMQTANDLELNWEEKTNYFPAENGDSLVTENNTKNSKIKLKNFSLEYRENLRNITISILENEPEVKIDRAIKYLDKVQ